jgi:hypothetical protein
MQGKAALFTLLCGIILMGSSVYAQDSQPGPKPLPPSQMTGVGQQLIVWSKAQKPQPIQGQKQSTSAAPVGGESDECPVQTLKPADPDPQATPTAAEVANSAGSQTAATSR